MQTDVTWSADVLARFPELVICIGTITGIHNQKENDQLRLLKKTVYAEAKAKYSVEALKDNPKVRAYRDFYWKLDIDPTKTRPSGEALLRRVLNGNELPNISTVVDAYNLASMQTVIPISGFDKDRLNPPFHIRFAKNEAFTGIGMDKPMQLTEKMLILTDEKQVLCVYPYRDSDHTKITLSTQKAVVIGYGAPRIAQEQLKAAVERTLEYIKRISGGEIETIRVFGRFT
ncbi:MAG: phenylalanine--tRNA ligase beta subunit-related protein [Candidatus Bathyarchaeia archaeon]|jgi:DNA/RNA-binding domain of Phe-tRNA-synthetase-like protein